MTITTTLNAIRKHEPCEDVWKKLLASLGKTSADDEPLPLLHILDSNGFDDALWCLRALGPEHARWRRLLACDFAESVLKYVLYGETRPAEAIRVSRLYADGNATQQELDAAEAAADGASEDADEDAAVAAASAAAAAARGCADGAADGAAWATAEATTEAADWAAAAAERERIFREAIEHGYRAEVAAE